eukprot:6333466-Prymnesium_polylepis.1
MLAGAWASLLKPVTKETLNAKKGSAFDSPVVKTLSKCEKIHLREEKKAETVAKKKEREVKREEKKVEKEQKALEPKAPQSSFFLYAAENRPRILEAQPDLKVRPPAGRASQTLSSSARPRRAPRCSDRAEQAGGGRQAARRGVEGARRVREGGLQGQGGG